MEQIDLKNKKYIVHLKDNTEVAVESKLTDWIDICLFFTKKYGIDNVTYITNEDGSTIK